MRIIWTIISQPMRIFPCGSWPENWPRARSQKCLICFPCRYRQKLVKIIHIYQIPPSYQPSTVFWYCLEIPVPIMIGFIITGRIKGNCRPCGFIKNLVLSGRQTAVIYKGSGIYLPLSLLCAIYWKMLISPCSLINWRILSIATLITLSSPKPSW